MAGDPLKKKQSKPIGTISTNGKLFGYDQEGRFKLINIADNAVVLNVAIPHIDSPATCLIIFEASIPTTITKNKKRKAADDTSLPSTVVVFGFADGNLIILDVQQSTFSELISAHRSTVNDLSFDSELGVLYSAGQDGYLKQWSMKNLSSLECKHDWRVNGDPVYRILLDASRKTILVGQYQILLWDLTGESIAATYTGHMNGVSKLYALNEELFISLGENDSTSYVWSFQDASGPKGIMTINEPIVDVISVSEDQIFLHGTSQSIYELSLSQKSKKHVMKCINTTASVTGTIAIRDNKLAYLQLDRFYSALSSINQEDQKVDVPLTKLEEDDNNKNKKKRKKATAVLATEVTLPKPQPSLSTSTESKSSTTLEDSTKSIAILMSQALTTEDNSLLEQAFSVVDSDRITATVQTLDNQFIPRLLKALKLRLLDKPNRIHQLQHWIIGLVNLRRDHIRSNSESLKQIQDLLQLCTMQGSLLPKAMIMRRIEQLKEMDVGKRIQNDNALADMTSILYYDEETGKNVFISNNHDKKKKKFAEIETEEPIVLTSEAESQE